MTEQVRPRHVRRRQFKRLRWSDRFLTWLTEQATRLELTSKQLFEELLVEDGHNFEQVEGASGPVSTVLPAITGTPTVGQELSVSNGTWGEAAPTFAYQWTRDGTVIAAATVATYTLVADDAATMIGCTVTATTTDGSTDALAEAVGPVAAA